MRWMSVILNLVVFIFGLRFGASALVAQGVPEKLSASEYDVVALIYNGELSALGERAIYPICLTTPFGASTKALLKYLRRGGYPFSDARVCNPPPRHRDYPHGMRFDIDKVRHVRDGELDVLVTVGDDTIHYGVHFGTLLRRGTYHCKRDEKGEWQLASYAKEYDYKDEEARRRNCGDSNPLKLPQT